jgi:hypothetical protein
MDQNKTQQFYHHLRIITSTRAGIESFDSIEAMPSVLRATCVKVLEDKNTSTILIADRRGLAAWHAAQAATLVPTPTPATPAFPPLPVHLRAKAAFFSLSGRSAASPWRLAADLIFYATAGLLIWLLATR